MKEAQKFTKKPEMAKKLKNVLGVMSPSYVSSYLFEGDLCKLITIRYNICHGNI